MVGDTQVRDSILVYARTDYAGLGRRIAICIVDGLVILVMLIPISLLAVPLAMAGAKAETLGLATTGLWLICTLVYAVVLKVTPFRTLGYWITGTRILDHRGKRPSIARMAFRALWWYAMPPNVLVDFLWMLGDHSRQTLGDKFTGLYVLQDRATPLGPGRRQMILYTLLGYTYAFWEVRPTAVGWPARPAIAQKETGG